MELLATCAFGLEKLVHDELNYLGLPVLKTEDGRLTFRGNELDMVWANLWLRCADRVQIKMGEFDARTFTELFDAVNALPWEKYIGANDVFPIKATSVKSVLHSEPAIQSIVKKAVVKKLQQYHTLEVFPESSQAVYQIVVKANKDRFVISIDSSGESLHKRGYRTKANAAPIKETLAAAMIKLSDWKAEKPLIEPFCGSGTIAIEAAMIANNIAPGLKRSFAFQNWPWLDQKKVQAVMEEAKQMAKTQQKLPIYCFDIDPNALIIAEQNAKNAGFPNLHFKRSDYKDLDFSKFENATFITNPPYGERLEDRPIVEEMYKTFGKKFTQTKNCSLYLLTSVETFPQLFGKPANKNRKLFNGTIRCYLFSYFAFT